MQTQIERLRAYVDENREKMLGLWEQLVNMQGGSHEIDNVNKVIDFVKETLEAEEVECRVLDSKGSTNVLVAEINSKAQGKPVLMCGHCDTVFPAGSYPANPFTVDEEGFAHGPGVLDMKNGIAQMCFILIALKQMGFKDRHVKALIVGDEENGHVNGITGELLLQEGKGALCCFNMESGRMDNCLTVGRKGGMDCHITVHGVAAHAGNDYLKGRNAIIEMSHKLPLLQNLSLYDEGLTVSVGVVKGGMASNVVPDCCYAELDIRYKNPAHMEYIKEKINEVCAKTYIEGTTTEVEFISIMPAFAETEANYRLLDYINSVAVKYGYPEFGSIYVGGMSDAAYFSTLGIPTVCSMGAQGAGAHTKEEHASVASFFERWIIAMSCIMEAAAFEENYQN